MLQGTVAGKTTNWLFLDSNGDMLTVSQFSLPLHSSAETPEVGYSFDIITGSTKSHSSQVCVTPSEFMDVTEVPCHCLPPESWPTS